MWSERFLALTRRYDFACIGLALNLILVSACQTRPSLPSDAVASGEGSVSYKLIPSLASGQYKLKKSEHAFGAQAISRDDPTYPQSLVDKHLPDVTIRVKAIVNSEGMVTEVRDLDSTDDAQHALFFAACKSAVLRWSFSPMVVVTETDDGRGNISQDRSPRPFSLDYMFTFSSVNGRPTVLGGEVRLSTPR